MNVNKIAELFGEYSRSGCATAQHLPTLRRIAKECANVVEFGVKQGASASAFLLGCNGTLYSWDLVITGKARRLKRAAGKDWRLHEGDIRDIKEIPVCDMIFFDSLHTYEQLNYELRTFGKQAQKFLVFHDTISFAIYGADGETGKWQRQPSVTPVHDKDTHGIRLAIDEFMVCNPEWKIKFHFPYGHGLLCLEKQ